MNKSISYTDIRKNLKASCYFVSKDYVPLLVERRNGGDVVILSKDDYTSLEETAYLLSSPRNAQRLFEALQCTEGKAYKDAKEIKMILEFDPHALEDLRY